MDGSSSPLLDQAICDSCKHIFTEKDKIIDDMKRNLQTQENRVQTLENKVRNLEEQITNAVAEKEAFEQRAEQLSVESEKDRNLELLQDQLKHLEEEKKYLNEKIHDFEHETAGLARMFGMQQEKFEDDIKNKDNIIKAIEKKRKHLEEEMETTRNDLGKLKKEGESGKQLVENLKASIQEKDEEALYLSHLHDDAKKLVKELEEKLTVSDENLRNERSKNKVLEENISSYMDNIEALSEENRHLNTEINHLRNTQGNVSQEKSRVEKEIQRLNDRIECLQNKVKESERNYVELVECNAKLKQDKNGKEFEIQKLEKKDVELRIDIEKLKKEIVLVTDQKHALETKMSLVQAEIKNLERLRKRLEQELFDSHKRLEKAEENLERRTIEKRKSEEEVKALEQVINDLMIKNKQTDERLDRAEENLENETKKKEELEEAVKAMEQVINDLKNSIKQQNNCLEETKRELDTVIGTKQQLLMEVEKLEDANKDLKIKINTLSQDIESMHDICETKARKLEDLERTLNEKSRIIVSCEDKEKELQSHVDELVSIEEICANELKNAREEITKLRKENANIEENYERITVQFQECLQNLSEKNEMYMKSRTHNEKQMAELTRFRELNAEINDELRNRNDEISLLTIEKNEIQREFAFKQNLIEKNSLMQSNLNKEVESMKTHMEKCKENEKETLQKLSEAKKKYETAIRQLDNETDEKNDLKLQLKYSREKVERWKKLSFEIKEERNRLQMQIAELDRDLNEKHSNLAEEKSSLEKEMGTLKNIVKRLKSNEGNLRGKIEELRDEVDKLSDVNSEQEMQIRKLSWEKERMTENLVRLKSVAEENAALQNECKEINCEKMKLNNDVDGLQEKARNIGDENERLQKELKILQSQFDVMEARVHETTQECKQLKNERNILKDTTTELLEEKERLFNENCRLKEKKNSIIQDRNKLQDMIESLDKCHSEKNDGLSRQNALLENELVSRRSELKRGEEKESKLLNEIQQLDEKIEKSMEENDKINGLLKKTDCENTRLRKKVADLAKLVEQIEQEKESRIYLETELSGREQLLNKYKESMKKLNDLISTLYRQQNELKDELRNKEREFIDLSNVLKTEQSDKLKCKDVIRKLEEELKTTKTRELKCIDEMQNEKEKNEHVELALTRIKKERNDFKDTSRKNENEYNKKVEELESETRELLDKIAMLQKDNDEAKLFNVNLDIKLQNLEEEMRSLTDTKSQLIEKLKKKDEQLGDIAKENNTLTEENKRLQERAENIDMILSLQNSAALDQASGMEKQIRILHDTLAKLQNTEDMNRSEIDELRRKLKTVNEDKMSTEVKLNDNRLERKRLENKNNELLSNCARLENLVKEGEHLKLEKEDKERLLETAQQKHRVLDGELAGKTRELLEKEQVVGDLKEEISHSKELIEKLNTSRNGLIVSVEELTQINDEGLKEFKLMSEKNEELFVEKNRLTELVVFHKDEMEILKRETDEIKTELQFKIQEAENDKFQLQSDVNMKEENLHRLTEKNNELQESLKNVKEEVDDLENENEDLLAEVEQLKEVNKKAKEVRYTLQTEHSVLQEDLREKENNWNEEKGKISLEIFKMETDITNLNDRLTQANERNEKQRELEKMLRLEIDELSDGYVQLEEEIQHRNDENLSLKEQLQTLTQNIEELELARDTAYLLKEKRHCELLNSEKNVQRLEKHLKEKQKTSKKLQKELDSIIEKEKFLELQISSEKELSGQRLKQIQELQNSQRKVDEQLWKAERDIEKLGTEIGTWRTSSDSMKVRIETLEDELKKTTNEKQIVLDLYKETKKINETKEEQILKLRSEFSEKTADFEAIIGEMNNEKFDFNQNLNDLEELLDKKLAEIATLEEIVETIRNKYEGSLLVTSLLHNDIQRKDERIADLEERKKQVTNLLTDLDLKIAEIQVQAGGLETDNELLRQQLTRAITSDENLRQKLEDEQRIFAEKYEKSSREIQHLQEMKDHFAQLALEANSKVEDKNSALTKLQEDYEKLISDKHCLNNTKERLENKLREAKSQELKLKQTLSSEKEKTLKQSLELEHLLKDCNSLMAKHSLASEEHKETEKKLMKANTVCQGLNDLLEERNVEILKIREYCENWKDKANQLEESLSVSTTQNEKLLQIKNEEIRSLTTGNRKLRNMIDEIKSELDEQTARNNTNEFENRSLKEKLEQKQTLFNDLEVSYQNTMNSKDSLEVENKGLSTKIKSTSRNLETLKTARQQLITENEELNCVLKTKEKELEECCNAFRIAEQKLDEEIFDHKTTVENLLVENNDLRQKVNIRNTQLKETKNSLEEITRKLEDQVKENKRLNLAIKNLNFERNCLADVNLKVSDALRKLKNESGRKQTQQGNEPLESDKKALDEHGESDFSWQSKQVYAMKSFELQNNFLQVENEIHTLRSFVSNKENEITRLEVSLDLLQNEMDVQYSQVSNYKQKFEDESRRRENALEVIKQLEADLEHLKEEKYSIATESQQKLMHVQQELLANELVICDLRGKNARLEDKIREIKTSDEEKTEQIKKLQNLEITRISEVETADKIMEKTLFQILKLEEALFVCEEKNDLIFCSGENNRKDRYDELSSTLMHRFERVMENIQSQLRQAKQLEKELNDAETQSSIHRQELQASDVAYRNLKVECEQLQNQLFLETSSHDEALCKIAELSESLLTAETNLKRTKILQNEENSKISQELQKMQRELTLACEKFNCSISKARSLEQKIQTKEKLVADLEEALKISGVNSRMLQIRIAELETTTEILFNTNKELEDAEKEYMEKIVALQFSLQQEKAGRNEDIAERAATMRQLELKNENSEQQVVRSKELLSKTDKTTKELQKELEALQSRYKESETASSAEIADCQSKILQLQQNISNLEEDSVRLENDSCVLARKNEYLLDTIANVEKENKDHKNILKQNKQEKEIQNKRLEKMFDVTLNEEVRNDINDQSKKLERVIEVIKDLKRCRETLTKEKKDVLENVLKLKKENEEIHTQYQTKCKDYELLKQHSNKLTDLKKNLENDLERYKINCKQLNAKIQELEDTVETLKVNEDQQQYQYHVLEKEKEDLENEAICIDEGLEKFTEKLNESVYLLHEFHPDTASGNLDDSGIGTEENSVQMMSNRETLDSGVFSSGFDNSITFPPSSTSEDGKVGNEKMRQMEMAVDMCVQMMSKVGPTFAEKSKFFSNKEQQLIEQIRMLKEASVQNEDLLSSLEEEVERLELSHKSLQETYQEKDVNLKECQMKLEHSITIANKKEMSITILNESVQEYRKQQESLEKELNKAKMANEQLNKEKLQTAIAIQDYEKKFEEHRQQCLKSDAENEKGTKSLRSKITELENQILEKQNAHLKLQDFSTTLHETVDQLNNREKEYLLTITSYQDQVQDLEKQKREDTKLAEELSQELYKRKDRIMMLETMCQETQASVKDLKEKMQKASTDLEKSCKEVIQLNEKIIRIRLERDSLTDDAKIRKEQLKEKKSTIEHLSSELKEKDEIIRKNETKLKLVQELLQEMNKSKDNLEKDVNEIKDENRDLRKQIELLKYENKCFFERLTTKEEEVIEKDNLNYELDKDNNEMKCKLLANNGALEEATDELRMSLAEVKRINNVIENLHDLFDLNAGHKCSTTDCQEGMDTYNRILSVGRKLNNLSLVCQKIIVERESLRKNVEEKDSLLQNEKCEKSTLEREKQYLDEKVSALSKAIAEVKLSLSKQEQELGQSRNELSTEKKRNYELYNVNQSLEEQVKLLEDNILSISTHAESLNTDRKNLEESLMKAQNQVAKLNSKYEQLDVLNGELRAAKYTINELNNLQDKTITAKEDAEKELECTRQKLADLETSLTEQTKLLSDTQVILTQEQGRIVTLTKLARMKERDMENAKMAIKLKDELIGQMKEQIEQMKDTNSSTKEELAKAVKQLTTVQERKETLSNEKFTIWKDCAVLKDRLEQIQKEKQALEMKLDSETKKTSMTLEKLEKQKKIITDLRDEVKLQKHQCEQLENEKSKLTKEATDREKRLEFEREELVEKSHSQSKSWDSTLLHMKSELSLSESLRSELEQRIAGNEMDLLALQDENFQLQAEIETCGHTIKELSNQENKLISENKCMKESVKNISGEKKRLKNCHEKVQQELEIMKTTLAEKKRENNILQKKMLSSQEIIFSLRNVTLNSKSEMDDLKCKVLENTKKLEKVNKELVHERNTVSTLNEDKTNLEELYRLSQNLETDVKRDLEDAKLQINDIRNENLNLRKENTSLNCKLQKGEKTIKDLKFDIQTSSAEKLEINNMLTEARRGLEKANGDLYRVCSAVAKISTTTRTMLNEIHANVSEPHFDIYSHEDEKNNEPSCSSLKPSVMHGSSGTDAVCEELRTLEMELRQIDSSFKQLHEIETMLKNNIDELTLMNRRLSNQDERQGEKILQEDRRNLPQKNDQLGVQNKELVKLCEKLTEECRKLKELLSNECTITTEISNELSTLKDEKQRLCEKNNELEVSLDQCVKENVDLNAKHEGLKQEIETMCDKLSSLEISHATLCQEKREIDETAFKRKEQILVLENDLKASVEFSELLEKQFTEERKNNTSLRLRVETLDSQVCSLEDNLKKSLSQINEMNSKVVVMNEEIRQTGFVLCEKEKQISWLREELKKNDEKLKKSTIQVGKCKTAHEDILRCKMETEKQLEQTELMLKRSEKLLHQEKQLTNDFTIEKDNIEKELQSTIMKLQERIEELMSELSATTTNEQTTKESLDSARDTIKQLENEVKEQLLKMKESERKRKTRDEELDNLKVNYTRTKAELEKTSKENEKLHEGNQELENAVERLETKITLHYQDSEQKLKEIENLEIQFASEKKAKENLQSTISTLQKNLEFLKKQNSEKEKNIKCIIENKTAEVDQISKKLVELINKTEVLQSNVNAVTFEKKSLEQRNEDICQEIFTTCQSLVKDLKSTEFGKSCDDNLLESSDSVTNLSKVHGMVRSSHTLVKDQINHLNTKFAELNERLKETRKEKKILLVEKTQLEDDLHRVQKESDTIQVDRNSLVKTLKNSQHDLKLNSSKIQTLEDEINEFKQQEKRLQATIEAKEEEYLVLHTKMELIENTRVSLEEEVGRLQLKLGNTIIELTIAKTTNEDLESKNSELISTNSRLLDDQAFLQNKLNKAGKETKDIMENLSLKESEISRLKTETYAAKEEKDATEKCLEKKEIELSHLKDNLNELERQKYDLENEMNKLREFNKQIEKDHEDLQLTSSQIQADNSQLRRELEREQTEKIMKTTRLQCDLEEALTSLEKQHCKLSQMQNDKDVVQNRLLEAEKELTVLMEDNADLKHQMYESKTTDKDELLKTRYQISDLRRKEVTLSEENKYLADQLQEKSAELRRFKLEEQKVRKEMENNREKMRRYLNDRDKWEDEVKSVISEIGHQKKSESTSPGTNLENLYQPKFNNASKINKS